MKWVWKMKIEGRFMYRRTNLSFSVCLGITYLTETKNLFTESTINKYKS